MPQKQPPARTAVSACAGAATVARPVAEASAISFIFMPISPDLLGIRKALNPVGDEVGCKRAEDGSVTTPPGFKDAYRQFCDAGWPTLTAPEEFGGQGLPQVIGTAVGEYVLSANHAFEMYQGLTSGAIAALMAKASDELKQAYIPKMVTGRWTGTMNLTEPHCGTDLGLLKTRAAPQADGSYAITGTKIFISSG